MGRMSSFIVPPAHYAAWDQDKIEWPGRVGIERFIRGHDVEVHQDLMLF